MTSIRSLIKKLFYREDDIIIVSGLPRSGTSLMMSALQAGGIPLLTDGMRKADPSNPKGYYEYEAVKKLPSGKTDWLPSARGKAVKVISALLQFLPEGFHYQLIFMERNLEEILASQQSMLERSGIEEAGVPSNEVLRREFQGHLEAVRSWLQTQDWIDVCYISYNQILRQPVRIFSQVSEFLGAPLDIAAMAQIVDPSLYREQN